MVNLKNIDDAWRLIMRTNKKNRFDKSKLVVSLDEQHADLRRVSFLFPTDLGRSKETLLAG